MTPRSVRIWKDVHKWTSLICTLFLFILCLTGLPLIFHEEIDRALGATAAPDSVAADAPMISLDRVLEIGHAQRPNEAITFAVPMTIRSGCCSSLRRSIRRKSTR
jgi:uncharacterized iron-regulated membrane protein